MNRLPNQPKSNHMFKQIMPLVVLVTSLLSIETLCGQVKGEDGKARLIREALTDIVTQEKLPGMIAAITNVEGVMAIASAGVRKEGSNVAMTDTDLIHIGSCTKSMTSTLLATFVKEGSLSWDTTIIEVFPELKTSIHPGYHKVTLWQLVTHRARLPANPKNWWVHRKMKIKKRRLAILKENLGEAPEQQSGEFLYSNLGYMIAGSMAEKISESSWETLIRKRLFDPLDMKLVGFGPPGTPGKTDQPWGHNKSKGKWQPKHSDNAEALGPAGRVHCSFEAWAKFISLQLSDKQTSILDRKSLDQLIETDKGDYAAGWRVVQRPWAKGTALNHNGSNTIWYAVMWVAPESNRAFIVATNSRDDKSAELCDKMIGKLIEIDKAP